MEVVVVAAKKDQLVQVVPVPQVVPAVSVHLRERVVVTVPVVPEEKEVVVVKAENLAQVVVAVKMVVVEQMVVVAF